MKNKQILGAIDIDEKGCLIIDDFNDYYNNYQFNRAGICGKDARIAELRKLAAFYLETKE